MLNDAYINVSGLGGDSKCLKITAANLKYSTFFSRKKRSKRYFDK